MSFCEIVNFEKWKNYENITNRYKNNAHDLMVVDRSDGLGWLYVPNHIKTCQQLFLFRDADPDAAHLL